MKNAWTLAPVLAALLHVSGARGAQWYSLLDQPIRNAPANEIAREFVAKKASEVGVSAPQLALVLETSLGDFTTVRYQQTYRGLPVIGTMVAVRMGREGTIRAAVIDVSQTLNVDPNPTLSASQAIDAAEGEGNMTSPRLRRASLGVLPSANGGHLVWQVDTVRKGSIWRSRVDAHSAEVIDSFPMHHGISGRVYRSDPATTPTPEDLPLPGLGAGAKNLTGYSSRLSVYDFVSGDLNYGMLEVAQRATPNVGEDFIYDPNPTTSSPTDPFSEVNAYYHAARMRSFFQDTLKFDLSSPKYALAIVTEFAPGSGAAYLENAFYGPGEFGLFPRNEPHGIFLGRGIAKDLSYDSDILLHEFTHYVVYASELATIQSFFDNMGLSSMPGGVSEGTADYFASSMNDNPVIGQWVLGKEARDLSKSAGRCPDNVYGESHLDGRLVGNTTWALRSALGRETTDQLIWGSMLLFPVIGSFGDFSRGIRQTAMDLHLTAEQVKSVDQVLAATGFATCDRTLHLEANKPLTTNILGLDLIGQHVDRSCSELRDDRKFQSSSLFHFEHKPIKGLTAISFKVDHMVQGSGTDLRWNIYVRKGGSVTFDSGGTTSPVVGKTDYAAQGLTTTSGELTIGPASNPPFDDESSYEMLIVHQNCPLTRTKVSLTTEGTPEPVDAGSDTPIDGDSADATEQDAAIDAGVDVQPVDDAATLDASVDAQTTSGQTSDESGCSCQLSSSSTYAGWLGVLVALIASLVARRNRNGEF